MLKYLLHKTLLLTRFNLKKDIKRISIWLIVLILFTLMIGIYFTEMPMTDADRTMMLETLKSPAMILIVGTAPSVVPTVGAMFAVEMTLFTAIIVAIMNVFMVAHNTREDEEAGRLEIIRALPTGRLSNLAAACIQAFIVNIVLAFAIGLSLGTLNFGNGSINSGMLFGFILGGIGFVFAMVTAVSAQLFQSNRTAITASFAFLGFNFIFRGITDISNPLLSWLSPLSWSYKTEVYVNNNWFPILLMFMFAFVMMIIAMILNSKRDLDGCFIKQKAGKTRASKILLTPFGFIFILNKTTLIGWMIGIVVLGLTFGSVFGELENFFTSNNVIQMIFPGSNGSEFIKLFINLTSSIFAIVIAIPVLTFIGRIYTEEKKNHMENIVSKSISCNKLLGTYLKFSLITSIIFAVFTIFSIYVVGYSVVNLKDILIGMLLFMPAIWFVLGLGVFLVGTLPKLFGVVWLLLGYAFFIAYFGEMIKIPDIVKKISPFYHIQTMSADNIEWPPLFILVGIGVILTLVGFINYRKRDISA